MPGENRLRDATTYIQNGKKFCEEKWEKLDVLSVFGFSTFTKDGSRKKFEFFAPEGTSVYEVLKEIPKDFLDKLDAAAYKDITEKMEKTGEEKNEVNAKKTDVVHAELFPKPDRPIYNLSDADMGSYFPELLDGYLTKKIYL